MVKNSYCGDAYISGRETQAASFRSQNEARRFANALTNSTGYKFYVKESQAR
jgi:serine/threonine-protein kinase